MKTRILYLSVLLCVCALCPMSAVADQKNLTDIQQDSLITSHKVIQFGSGEDLPQDSINRVILRFYADQFRHFQDPLAPYFLFMSKSNQLAMGMGGCVRMRGWYDWGGSIPTPGFIPYLIPMQKDPDRRRHLGTTPAGTALFFRVLGMNKKYGSYELYIETNFDGWQMRGLNLKKAYGRINDFTIGYTNSTFSDPSALPPAIDAAGPNAKMTATSVLVRWLHEFKKGFAVAASVETPEDNIEEEPGKVHAMSQWIPDIAAFGQYSWKGSNHVRLAAILRSLPYRDVLADKVHNMAGWGLHLSTVLHPTSRITVYGMLNGGQGFASLGGDWLMGAYDLVADPKQPGRLYSPFCYGGYAAAQYNFTPNIFMSATFGGTRYAPKHDVAPDDYKQGLYIAANVFWYLTPRISCGAEFNLGRRLNFSGDSQWARRAGAFAQFSF